MKILIYAEYEANKQQLSSASLATLKAAHILRQKLTDAQIEPLIDIVICHDSALKAQEGSIELDLAQDLAINKIICLYGENLQYQLVNQIAPKLTSLAEDYNYIMAANNSNGKSIMPFLAAHCKMPQLSDIIEIIDKDSFKRVCYSGNVIATIKSSAPQKLLTLRETAFASLNLPRGPQNIKIENIAVDVDNEKVSLLSRNLNLQNHLSLDKAKIVICGGRALQNRENFTAQLQPIADKLKAAIGATRAAVDAEFAPNEWQIGQTGKIIAPNLYIAVGLSGAQQHIMGIREAKYIVAINIDKEAPIVKIADYALIGDLFEILPQLNDMLV